MRKKNLDYEGLRDQMLNEYCQLFKLHERCLEFISEMIALYIEDSESDAWKWRMRLDWHERMKTSIARYLLKRYRADKSFLISFFREQQDTLKVKYSSERNLKKALFENIDKVIGKIEEILEFNTTTRQVHDMLTDHKYILKTLYPPSD
ncbi:MAG: hypothetical protein R3275_06330 [Saprospiraceae bacterium]|nr:hypothetical protein [Saprospiraceae bacterium]